MVSQPSINAEKRLRDAVLAAKKKGFLRALDEELINETQVESICYVPPNVGALCMAMRLQNYDGHSIEFDQIQRISLFACPIHTVTEMTIAACTRLVICNLANCYLTDISAFHSSVNLLKLDVSCNHVRSCILNIYPIFYHTRRSFAVLLIHARSLASALQIVRLPSPQFWSSLPRLKVAYLHGNLLNSRDNLLRLASTPQLHILTMYDTPVSLHPSYRHTAVNW